VEDLKTLLAAEAKGKSFKPEDNRSGTEHRRVGETNAITAVVPPVKNTSWTSRPFFSKIPASLAIQAGIASPLMAL
jgi:hypothetical protein